jgi:hypothetical protein
VGECAFTRCLTAVGAIALGELEYALCTAQALDDAVIEKLRDERGTGWPDALGLCQAPRPVLREVGLRLGRQMVMHGAPLASVTSAL